MTSTWKASADSLVSDLRNVFGTRLLAVVAYGPRIEGDTDTPLTCLALVSSLTAEDLQSCAQFARRWSRAHIATPLILPSQEFIRSLDTFPLEYGEIIRAHELVYGDNPFSSATIASDECAGRANSRPRVIWFTSGRPSSSRVAGRPTSPSW